MKSKDVSHILDGWLYEPGKVSARKVVGDDGREKIQMRLDLGLFQMEMIGRPDAKRPHGMESFLEFHVGQLEKYQKEHGTTSGFDLTSDDCQDLREEGLQYYYRYLCLFHLEEFDGVVRDTERNLGLLDFVKQHAPTEDDRMSLEVYRPYITMMNARARSCRALTEGSVHEAMKEVRRGIDRIETFLHEYDQPHLVDSNVEIKVLKSLEEEIHDRLPKDPATKLRDQLDRAVQVEDYERAASLRDAIKEMEAGKSSGIPEE